MEFQVTPVTVHEPRAELPYRSARSERTPGDTELVHYRRQLISSETEEVPLLDKLLTMEFSKWTILPSTTPADTKDCEAELGEAERHRRLNEPVSPSYLGLVLDARNGELSRVGRAERELLTPLKIKLLKVFLQNRDSLTSRDRLLGIWRDDGGNPEAGTIDNELCELRGILGHFGVTIANRRRLGWRLQESTLAQSMQ